MRKKVLLTALTIVAVIGLTACNKLDVVGTQSTKSFEAMVNQIGDKVSKDNELGGWSLQAPDGSAKFIWSEDYSKTTKDVMLEVDAQPFLDAGLDTSKLPEGMFVENKIVLGTDLGNDELKYDKDITPTASYSQIVNLYRDNIKYHTALDHYGVDLSNGNAFEWAKDMTTNDKDIVFVLNPELLISAGVDPASVEGWVFAKVEMMDEKGKKIEVDKFLKPFELDGKPEQ